MSILPQTPEDPLAPRLGDRLRIARERAGFLKLGEFADRIGCDRKTLAKYERGTAAPRAYLLRVIADEVGLTVEELTGDLEAGPDDGPGLAVVSTPPGTRTQNLRIKSPTLFVPDLDRLAG